VFEEVSYSSNKWAMICKGNLCLSLCLCVFVSVLYLGCHIVCSLCITCVGKPLFLASIVMSFSSCSLFVSVRARF